MNAPSDATAPRLLLIDDDRKLVRLLLNFLQAQGFAVSVAHDGAEGLQMLKEEPWDLVVLDVMLPRIDGFDVLQQLRRTSRVPVLMLTGRGGEDDLIRGLDRGADDYLPKTASSRELLARINALLRRAAAVAPMTAAQDEAAMQAISVGGLQVDPAAHRVQLDGRDLVLTQAEFELLAVLMRHRGRVCTREQLLHDVRDRRFEGLDRSIDVHVASLRKKLGDDSKAARFIRTVRAVGYLFIDPDRDVS